MDSAALTPLPAILTLLAHPVRWRMIAALANSDYRAGELVAALRQSPTLVSYHLKQLQAAGLVSSRRSSADARDRYYHLDLEQLRQHYREAGHQLQPNWAASLQPAASAPWHALVLCTHNSVRSQMAEALFRTLGHGRVEASSAGTQPHPVHPLAVEVMRARAIDIRQQRAKPLSEFAGRRFAYVITVCDQIREICPPFPGAPTTIHWSLPDPAVVNGGPAKQRAAFQQTAVDLTQRVEQFLNALPVAH